jgi:hypothetical protein
MTHTHVTTPPGHTRFPQALGLVFVVLLFALLGGYTVGKDAALRDNARDAAALEHSGTR